MTNSLKFEALMRAETEMQECVVLTTSPNPDVARVLARRLVESELAACVNVISGMESHYRWKGALECQSEHLLLIKTHEARLNALEHMIREIVPYETPEFLVVPVKDGSKDYLSWMRKGLGMEAAE
jgi:periplasmic divalent cation tolerance protein